MTKNKQENSAVKTNNKGVMKTNRKILVNVGGHAKTTNKNKKMK